MAERWEPDFLGPGFFARTFSLPDDDEGAVVTTVVCYRPEASNFDAGKAHHARAGVAQHSSKKTANTGDTQQPGENAGPGAEREHSAERKRTAEREPDAEQKRIAQPKRGAGRGRGAEIERSPEPEGWKANPRNPAFAFLAVHGWNDYFYQTELARYVDSIGGAFYAVDLRKYGRSLREGQTFGYIRNFDEYDDELHICHDLIYEELGSTAHSPTGSRAPRPHIRGARAEDSTGPLRPFDGRIGLRTLG